MEVKSNFTTRYLFFMLCLASESIVVLGTTVASYEILVPNINSYPSEGQTITLHLIGKEYSSSSILLLGDSAMRLHIGKIHISNSNITLVDISNQLFDSDTWKYHSGVYMENFEKFVVSLTHSSLTRSLLFVVDPTKSLNLQFNGQVPNIIDIDVVAEYMVHIPGTNDILISSSKSVFKMNILSQNKVSSYESSMGTISTGLKFGQIKMRNNVSVIVYCEQGSTRNELFIFDLDLNIKTVLPITISKLYSMSYNHKADSLLVGYEVLVSGVVHKYIELISLSNSSITSKYLGSTPLINSIHNFEIEGSQYYQNLYYMFPGKSEYYLKEFLWTPESISSVSSSDLDNSRIIDVANNPNINLTFAASLVYGKYVIFIGNYISNSSGVFMFYKLNNTEQLCDSAGKTCSLVNSSHCYQGLATNTYIDSSGTGLPGNSSGDMGNGPNANDGTSGANGYFLSVNKEGISSGEGNGLTGSGFSTQGVSGLNSSYALSNAQGFPITSCSLYGTKCFGFNNNECLKGASPYFYLLMENKGTANGSYPSYTVQASTNNGYPGPSGCLGGSVSTGLRGLNCTNTAHKVLADGTCGDPNGSSTEYYNQALFSGVSCPTNGSTGLNGAIGITGNNGFYLYTNTSFLGGEGLEDGFFKVPSESKCQKCDSAGTTGIGTYRNGTLGSNSLDNIFSGTGTPGGIEQYFTTGDNTCQQGCGECSSEGYEGVGDTGYNGTKGTEGYYYYYKETIPYGALDGKSYIFNYIARPVTIVGFNQTSKGCINCLENAYPMIVSPGINPQCNSGVPNGKIGSGEITCSECISGQGLQSTQNLSGIVGNFQNGYFIDSQKVGTPGMIEGKTGNSIDKGLTGASSTANLTALGRGVIGLVDQYFNTSTDKGENGDTNGGSGVGPAQSQCKTCSPNLANLTFLGFSGDTGGNCSYYNSTFIQNGYGYNGSSNGKTCSIISDNCTSGNFDNYLNISNNCVICDNAGNECTGPGINNGIQGKSGLYNHTLTNSCLPSCDSTFGVYISGNMGIEGTANQYFKSITAICENGSASGIGCVGTGSNNCIQGNAGYYNLTGTNNCVVCDEVIQGNHISGDKGIVCSESQYYDNITKKGGDCSESGASCLSSENKGGKYGTNEYYHYSNTDFSGKPQCVGKGFQQDFDAFTCLSGDPAGIPNNEKTTTGVPCVDRGSLLMKKERLIIQGTWRR